jgi:ribosomal protein S18 acetylase RimI-like enzyme
MRVAQELVSYRTVSEPPTLAELRPVRAYGPDDFERVCEIDAACFDEFWRYGPELLKRYLDDERSTVVECEGAVAGFAFCSVRSGEGALGRVAVEPGWRGRGAGLSLVHEATSHMLASGAGRVGLCTQADNLRSRLLYSGLGFTEDPERLFMLVSSSL